jgi:hypothetical protein
VTVATKDGAPDLWLEGNLVVFTAMIADYLEAFRRLIACRGFFRAAFRAPLGCHQIALVKDLLFLLSKYERLFALDADYFDVGHRNTSLIPSMIGLEEYITFVLFA